MACEEAFHLIVRERLLAPYLFPRERCQLRSVARRFCGPMRDSLVLDLWRYTQTKSMPRNWLTPALVREVAGFLSQPFRQAKLYALHLLREAPSQLLTADIIRVVLRFILACGDSTLRLCGLDVLTLVPSELLTEEIVSGVMKLIVSTPGEQALKAACQVLAKVNPRYLGPVDGQSLDRNTWLTLLGYLPPPCLAPETITRMVAFLEDESVRLLVLASLSRMPIGLMTSDVVDAIVQQLSSQHPVDRQQAIAALANMPIEHLTEDVADVILLEVLSGVHDRGAIARCLARMHLTKETVTRIVSFLSHKMESVRDTAAATLRLLPLAPHFVDDIIALFKAPNRADVRRAALQVLETLGIGDQGVLSVVLSTLQDQDERVRIGALCYLTHVPALDDQGLRKVVAKLHDVVASVRCEAVKCLRRLLPPAEFLTHVLPILRKDFVHKLSRHEVMHLRLCVLTELDEIPKECMDADVLLIIVGQLETSTISKGDLQRKLHRAAGEILVNMPSARMTSNVMNRLLIQVANPYAARVVGSFGRLLTPLMHETLIALTSEDNPQVLIGVCNAVQHMPADIRTRDPYLRKIASLLDHAGSSVRKAAIRALGSMLLRHAPETIGKLIELLRQPDLAVCAEALKVLSSLPLEWLGQEAMLLIQTLCGHDDLGVKRAARQALLYMPQRN